MIRIVISLFFLWIGPVAAQQINIRSGAHADFARLALDVPPGTAWNAAQNANGVELTIVGHSGGFETSTIFERIDRSFISSVSYTPSSLKVEFSCPCDANVFAEGPNMIVLDVSAIQSAPAGGIAEADSLEFVGLQTLRFGTRPTADPQALAPIDDVPSDPTPSLPIANKAGGSSQLLELTQGTIPLDVVQLRAAREQIARQIGTAATRGLLDSVGTDQNTPSAPQIDTSIFDTLQDDAIIQSDTSDASSNIKISNTSVFTPDVRTALTASNSDGLSCIDPQLVGVQGWGTEDSLSQTVALLRSQLYGEFDELNENAALQLARTYIYFGFGAEARQTLFLDRNLRSNYPELSAIAEILEFGYSPNSQYLSRFLECKSDAALWAVLSIQNIDPSTSINVNSALRAASALPMHLRKFLAPELSRRLLGYGDKNSASAALRSLERAPQPLGPSANLAKANIELSEDNFEQAQKRLADIVSSNTEQSAKALIKFVDSHLAEDSEIDENVATLVEAYAKEMRDDPLEIELRRTHVLALGKSGQFLEAFDTLSRMRARSPNMVDGSLRSSVLELLTRGADDVEFLEHAFEQSKVAPQTLTSRSRFYLAERLVDLGFSMQAELVLNSGPDYSDREQVALLRAEISLVLDRPYEALAHLFGFDTEPASLLRAQAEAFSGDYSTAHSIYAELGDQSQSQRTAWLSQDWSLRVEDATPVFGPMVSIAQMPLDDRSEREGMLERTETALSESQAARVAIQELLGTDALLPSQNE